MPHRLVVFDSLPGTPAFLDNAGPWSLAMALGAVGVLPRWWPLVVSRGLALVFLALTHAVGWVLGTPSAPEFSVAAVNDPGLVDRGTRKLYLYGDKDAIINYRHIVERAADARTSVFEVNMVLFEGSGHVGHMRKWSDKYWGAVRREWDLALERDEVVT